MSTPLNVALLGSKFMGRTHSNAYLNVAKFFELPVDPVMHTICARDAEDLSVFGPRWGWRNWSTDWKSVVEDPEIGLVDIGTPNHVHRDQAIAALEAGKHVACEKPLAGTLDEAREMKDAAAAKPDQKTFVWFNYRRCPAIAYARQLVRDGRLGRLFHVRAAYLQDWGGPSTPLLWRFQGDQAGSGAHGDLNAHSIDMARFITGEEFTDVVGAINETFIEEREIPGDAGGEISGKGASSRGEKRMGKVTVDDAVLFLARLSGGAVASFEASRLSTGDKNRNRIEVHGEKGAIRFNFERMNELEWFDATLPGAEQGWSTINVTRGADGHPWAAAWWPDAHIIGYEHGFVNQAADMLKVLGGQEPEAPLPDFADAWETQRVLEAALLCAQKRAPVAIADVK